MIKKTCKTKNEIIARKAAFDRLMRIRSRGEWEPGLPPPEIFGIKTTKTGLFTLDELYDLCKEK